MPGIAEFSGHWEGRTIDDGYSLGHCLGAGENSLAYLTTFDSRRAVIKLVRIEPDLADAQLQQWAAASKISHLNLIRIFTCGRCLLDDISLLYVVMEYAEENLAEVVTERALTADETRDMLEPTLTALDYIHRQGLVHGHLKLSNILAADDRVKLSSDTLRRATESATPVTPGPYDAPERARGVLTPAGDVWSLGVVLTEALTQRLPGARTPVLAEPFASIVTRCLEPNPSHRWTTAQISSRLSGNEAVAAPKRRRPTPMAVLALVALLIVVIAGVMFNRSVISARSNPVKAPEVTVVKIPEPVPEIKPAEKTKPVAAAKTVEPAPDTTPTVHETGDQPMPDILAQARKTIRGKVIVNLKVDADPSGAVTKVTPASSTSSKYFTAQALKAVQQWKFAPVDSAQTWQVRFEFTSSGTKVSPKRLAP
jgi:TonB family protein